MRNIGQTEKGKCCCKQERNEGWRNAERVRLKREVTADQTKPNKKETEKEKEKKKRTCNTNSGYVSMPLE